MKTLKNKTVFITGASRGIGEAIALKCAQDGANVVIAAKSAEPNPKLPGTIYTVAEQVEKVGGKALALQLDVRDADQIQTVVKQAADHFGGIDILVNNAGATWGAPAEDHPLEGWDKLMNVNLTGAFIFAQQVAKKSMIPGHWGRIINTASIAGLIASDPRFVKTVAYNATKHGVIGLTRQLAAEWGVYGITVNAICPGFFPSKMTKATLDATGETMRELTPTRRLGNDEDLQGLAVLLASEASRHITGQAIAVDGGATLI